MKNWPKAKLSCRPRPTFSNRHRTLVFSETTEPYLQKESNSAINMSYLTSKQFCEWILQTLSVC